MVEILHAFAGPLRRVDSDVTAPATPGVDVSPETGASKMRIAILVGLGGAGFALFAYLSGMWTFEQAVHMLRMTPANDN